MNGCERTRKVHAYHDGELPPEKARSLEAHLAECKACDRELEALRGLSRRLVEADLPGAPPEALARLREIPVATNVVSLAKGLSAAAAAILILCGAWLGWSAHAETTPRAAAWEIAAVSPSAPVADDEARRTARWIVADLSLENGHE